MQGHVPLNNSIQKSDQPAGLPDVYQVYRREALRAKGFRRFLFAGFGGRSTKSLPRSFFEGETRGFLPQKMTLVDFW